MPMNDQIRKMTLLVIFVSLFLIGMPALIGADTEEEIKNKVDEYIGGHIKVNQFSGSILVAQKGQVIVKKGYGMANYEHAIPNDPRTKFRIASLTKSFTAMAIMQLEEKKLLSVDGSLNEYLPDYPEGDVIKIIHLLTHTSGIPDHTELPDFNQERRVFHHDVTETIEKFKNKPLEFPPGEKFKYSNSGYILLGYIIEKISQMSYEDHIEQNIFAPLNMSNSGFESPDKIIMHRASGYSLRDNEIINAKYRDMSNAHASGALYSTVEDMYLWDRALYTEKLISKDSLERMFTPSKGPYGYGWGIVDIFGRKMVAHNGEVEGFRTNISRFPDDDVCIIVLSNNDNTQVGKMGVELAAIVFGEKYSTPQIRETIAVDPSILDDYVGEYELAPGFFLTITKENNRLFCQATGQSKVEIHPESETEFFLKEVDAQISFKRDDNGQVEELILHQGGRDIEAKRVESK